MPNWLQLYTGSSVMSSPTIWSSCAGLTYWKPLFIGGGPESPTFTLTSSETLKRFIMLNLTDWKKTFKLVATFVLIWLSLQQELCSFFIKPIKLIKSHKFNIVWFFGGGATILYYDSQSFKQDPWETFSIYTKKQASVTFWLHKHTRKKILCENVVICLCVKTCIKLLVPKDALSQIDNKALISTN